MAKSALEQVKELEEQKHALVGKAKEEALAKATEAIEELKALGFNYRLWKGKEGKETREGPSEMLPAKSAASRLVHLTTVGLTVRNEEEGIHRSRTPRVSVHASLNQRLILATRLEQLGRLSVGGCYQVFGHQQERRQDQGVVSGGNALTGTPNPRRTLVRHGSQKPTSNPPTKPR